jgi:hypothetical protein
MALYKFVTKDEWKNHCKDGNFRGSDFDRKDGTRGFFLVFCFFLSFFCVIFRLQPPLHV